ncbi:MAG: tetratricopeptide repeat protein [Planctomycetota bacterium]
MQRFPNTAAARRRLRHRAACAAVAAFGSVLLLCPACQNPQRAAREEALNQWNAARAQVKLHLAEEQLRAGNFETAADQLAEASRLDPKLPRLVPLQARLWLADGQIERAAELLEAAPADNPGRAERCYLLGVARQQQERWSEAAAAFTEAAALDEREVAYVVAAVQARLQLGEPQAALELLIASARRFDYTPAYQAAAAECHEQLGDWAAAASAWKRVAHARASGPDIRLRLAQALCRAGRPVEAIPVYRDALPALEPAAQDVVRLELAGAYLATDQPAAAREQAQLVLRGTPDDPAALRILALSYGQGGDLAAALRTARRALELDAGHVPTAELVAALAWRAGERDLARATARRLYERDVENAVALRVLAGTQPQ